MSNIEYVKVKSRSDIKNKKIKIKFLEKDFLEYVDQIIEKSKNSRVLVVLNTVRRAQELYLKIIKKVSERDLCLDVCIFHSQFISFQKDAIEDEWITKKYGKNSNEKNCILIGSQKIEESLDIDGCCLFTDLSPIDKLIQRMGRIWRFIWDLRQLKEPEVFIFIPGKIGGKMWKKNIKEHKWEGITNIYSQYSLLKTYYVLKDRKYIIPSKDTQRLIERTYNRSEEEPKWFKEHYDKWEERNAKEKKEAIKVLRKGNGILDEKYIDEEDCDDEENDVSAATRYITRPSFKFAILKNIEKISNDNYKLYFFDGAIIDINKEDFDEDKNIKKNIIKKKKYISKILLGNSLSLPIYCFPKKSDFLSTMKDLYKDNVLEYFFGRNIFAAVIDEDRNFLNINGEDMGCSYKYLVDIGLCKK